MKHGIWNSDFGQTIYGLGCQLGCRAFTGQWEAIYQDRRWRGLAALHQWDWFNMVQYSTSGWPVPTGAIAIKSFKSSEKSPSHPASRPLRMPCRMNSWVSAHRASATGAMTRHPLYWWRWGGIQWPVKRCWENDASHGIFFEGILFSDKAIYPLESCGGSASEDDSCSWEGQVLEKVK
jgi:hypothetical protein